MVPVELIVNELAGARYDIADRNVKTAVLLFTLPQSSYKKRNYYAFPV